MPRNRFMDGERRFMEGERLSKYLPHYIAVVVTLELVLFVIGH